MRREPTEILELGWLCATVGDRDTCAVCAQIARTGQAGAAQAHDHRTPGARLGTGSRLLAHGRCHRSFSVPSPASTRIRLMIQNRTITLGSAQPLSSK